MARVALTKITPTALTSNATNITDAAETTMATGAGNGVTFAYDKKDLIILNNPTGGNAIYSFIIYDAAGVSAAGGSITDTTITVATTKKHILSELPIIFQQADNLVYVDCDVAGEIAVINY